MKFLIKISILLVILSINSFALADMERALDLHAKNRFKEALPEFLIEAEKGNTLAKYHLSQIYARSENLKDEVKGFKWEKEAYSDFLELANNGDPVAQYYLGQMHCEGSRVDSSLSDLDKCLYWFRLASKNGNNEASYNLGIYYEFREGYINEAIKMYELSLTQGNVFAAGSLGNIYGNGVGGGRIKRLKKGIQMVC